MARFALIKRYAVLLPALAWLIALALAAWVGAYWYWRLAGPKPERSQYKVQTDPAVVSQEIASRHLFGAQQQAAADDAPVSSSQFKLIGVAANSGTTRGFAIIQENGQTGSIAAIEGEEFMPGIKLVKVSPQSVELSRGGSKETLRLIDNKDLSTPPVPVSSLGSSNSSNNTPQRTPQTAADMAAAARRTMQPVSMPATSTADSSVPQNNSPAESHDSNSE